MCPLQFYQKYLTNNGLIRANIGLEEHDEIENLEAFTEMLTIRISEDYFLELITDTNIF